MRSCRPISPHLGVEFKYMRLNPIVFFLKTVYLFLAPSCILTYAPPAGCDLAPDLLSNVNQTAHFLFKFVNVIEPPH